MAHGRVDLRAGVSRPFASRGRWWVIAVLSLTSAVARLSVPEPAVIALAVVSALESGYLLTYSRNVALDDAREFPKAWDLVKYARRGLSSIVVALPGVAAAFPLILLILGVAFAASLADVASAGFAQVVFMLIVWVLVVFTAPFFAMYVLEDRVSAAFRFRDNLSVGWRHRGLLGVPVAFGISAGLLQMALGRAAYTVTLSPWFASAPKSPPQSALGSLGSNPPVAVLALVAMGILAALVQVANAHLWGQYARELHSRRLLVEQAHRADGAKVD